MKDVSKWVITGFGENSTLEKFELLSPDNDHYVIKFPRNFDGKRTNWEDVNEIIAAKISKMLNIKTVDAEIAYYSGRRGCLMKNFRFQMKAEDAETAAALFSAEFGDEYEDLYSSEVKNQDLMKKFFSLFNSFSLFENLREKFVLMNLFDILIGNQDRHAHNWQVLSINQVSRFGPLYDNGASLGWQLADEKIIQWLKSETKMNQFYRNTRVKMGMDNKESPRINAKHVLKYLITNYSQECKVFYDKLARFKVDDFHQFLSTFPLISEIRKEFIAELVRFRRGKLMEAFTEGGVLDEGD